MNLQSSEQLLEAGLGAAFREHFSENLKSELQPISSVAELRYGYTTKATSDVLGPKFLRITDIQDGTVDWDCVPYCSEQPEDFDRYSLRAGDIVFARTGATTGKSYLIQEDVHAVAASYLIRLRQLSKMLLPEYLAFFFQSDIYWNAVRQGISGSTQGGFNASKLGELQVPVPPVNGGVKTGHAAV